MYPNKYLKPKTEYLSFDQHTVICFSWTCNQKKKYQVEGDPFLFLCMKKSDFQNSCKQKLSFDCFRLHCVIWKDVIVSHFLIGFIKKLYLLVESLTITLTQLRSQSTLKKIKPWKQLLANSRCCYLIIMIGKWFF